MLNPAQCTFPTLSVYFVNATSLAKPNALQKLGSELSALSIDIGLVAETWFNTKHCNTIISIDNYTLFRRDRIGRLGGGVCAYVRASIQAQIFNSPLSHNNVGFQSIEIMWLKCYQDGKLYFIACCYHPPKPKYHFKQLVDALSQDIDYISCSYGENIILICGDFNSLSTEFLEVDHGFVQLVLNPTHGANLIDKCFVNRSDLYCVDVINSLLTTKHKALYVHGVDKLSSCEVNTKTVMKVYDLREHNIDCLRHTFGLTDFTPLLQSNDINYIYSNFVTLVHECIDTAIPFKRVKIGTRDPPFVTPLVRSLLKTRNKLRRKGNFKEADKLADKINGVISSAHSRNLAKLSQATAKEMWAAVKPRSQQPIYNRILTDPNVVNSFFSSVCFDKDAFPVVISGCFSNDCDYSIDLIEPYEVEIMLRTLKRTSTGIDKIPVWLFRSCSFEIAEIVAHIFNISIRSGTVPSNWRTATVTPISKCPNPISLSDFRPISVTPILSRIAERLIVNRWLRPSIPQESIEDQYAFKPTGSTTCALIHLVHYISLMLENNSYVRCLTIDFSKAFDTVDHNILADKLIQCNPPYNVIKWIYSFLNNRSQITKIGQSYSSVNKINRGIVQGSAIGPSLYIVMKSDLKSKSKTNKLLKFADDANLLVPEFTDIDIKDEFDAILAWARINKMTLNMNKTKELVFHRPSPFKFLSPIPLCDIEVVREAKLLGVYFSDTFSMESHVNYILKICTQRSYLLKLLSKQGLSVLHLHTVFHALVMSRILYAVSSFHNFLSVTQVERIESFLKRMFRYGFSKQLYVFRSIVHEIDATLFEKVIRQTHCLHHLLPSVKPSFHMGLRPKGHPYSLPLCKFNMHRYSFISRCLFEFN